MHTKLITINMDANNHPNMPSGSNPAPHQTSFEVSDFFEMNDWIEDDNPMFSSGYNPQNPGYMVEYGITANNSSGNSSIRGISSDRCFQEANINRESGSSRSEKKETREKVAFKTKSEVEVLDDGFKWRKYGKKMVKNSPNPRNYYRCSVEGCPVKKRVERDNEDPRYVVTTYEGIHNHLQGPHQL